MNTRLMVDSRRDAEADTEQGTKVGQGASEPKLVIRGLRKTFGRGSKAAVAIEHLDLDIATGELVVLLGPSGCGKTTTLRCVAGLEEPDKGRIELGGSVVFSKEDGVHAKPERRGVGMVFQNYALWPHLTVRKNIEFPLRARRIKEGLTEDWAAEAAATVECSELMERFPSELSGGQQQRVALARGMVSRPGMMLFDEPLSNLDARLRSELRTEIRSLHERLQFSGLYVTHDQEEAMVVADRIVVMRDGLIEQVDTPQALFSAPATTWVAQFLGVTNTASVQTVSEARWSIGGAPLSGADPRLPVGTVELRIRPESVSLAAPDDEGGGTHTVVDAVVERTVFSGLFTDYQVRVGDANWNIRGGVRPGIPCLGAGDQCRVVFEPADLLAYTADGKLA